MKRINLSHSENDNVKFILFPDNQPHARIRNINKGDHVSVACSIDSALTLLKLAELANAIKHKGAICNTLYITYLLGARYDRIMVDGDSFDLEVIAQIINQMGFSLVYILDAHSKVSLDLIRNSENVEPHLYNQVDDIWDYVFICPDKGARNRIPREISENRVIYCEKSRDLLTGEISIVVNNPEKAYGKKCIIVDDICDGGGTFIGIAKQIEPKRLVLAVTHGIFSKGLNTLTDYFHEIITTNSLPMGIEITNNHKVKIVNVY